MNAHAHTLCMRLLRPKSSTASLSFAAFLRNSSVIFLTVSRRSFASTIDPKHSSSTVRNLNMASPSLVYWAKQALNEVTLEFKGKPEVVDPNSNASTSNMFSIDVAKRFLAKASPEFLECAYSSDEDRLVKVGRSVADILGLEEDSALVECPIHEEKDDGGCKSNSFAEESLSHVVEQCHILATAESLKVPTVRFGRTELQMPIVTLGCMRFQQTWGGNINNMDKVAPDGQANLVNILKHSILNLGMNHIETARGYGSSELQIGDALKHLFDEGDVKREDLIIQTKVNAMKPKAFRDTLENSFQKLQLDYIDLFSFHGLNMDYGYDLVFQNTDGENLIDIVKEYQAAGKIRHIGFSTHGQPELIRKCIETGEFEFANVHYHAFGSYTASGGGVGGGNEEIVNLMNEKDMGVFIISPYDKGGRLYAPSRKLRSLTLPDLDPIKFHSLWLFNHDELKRDDSDSSSPSSAVKSACHTQTIGAARPSDLDEPAIAAYLHANRKEEMLGKVRAIYQRLKDAEVEALGEDWVKSWHVGVPNAVTADDAYQFGQMLSLYNSECIHTMYIHILSIATIP